MTDRKIGMFIHVYLVIENPRLGDLVALYVTKIMKYFSGLSLT